MFLEVGVQEISKTIKNSENLGKIIKNYLQKNSFFVNLPARNLINKLPYTFFQNIQSERPPLKLREFTLINQAGALL